MDSRDPHIAKFSVEELARFHNAAKSIEFDAVEAISSCARQHGRDIAGALLVAFLRRSFGSLDSFPTPEGVVEKVNVFLQDRGLASNT